MFFFEYNVLVVRKGEGFKLTNVSDLYGKKIGARIGYKYPLIERNPNVALDRQPKDGINIRNLILGDTDAAIVGGVSDVYSLYSEGVMTDLEILNKALSPIGLGVELSSRYFNRSQLHRFNRLQASLKQSNVWRLILANNGMEELVVDWKTLK